MEPEAAAAPMAAALSRRSSSSRVVASTPISFSCSETREPIVEVGDDKRIFEELAVANEIHDRLKSRLIDYRRNELLGQALARLPPDSSTGPPHMITGRTLLINRPRVPGIVSPNKAGRLLKHRCR